MQPSPAGLSVYGGMLRGLYALTSRVGLLMRIGVRRAFLQGDRGVRPGKCSSQTIDRAPDAGGVPLQDVGVDHRRRDVSVTEKLLAARKNGFFEILGQYKPGSQGLKSDNRGVMSIDPPDGHPRRGGWVPGRRGG